MCRCTPSMRTPFCGKPGCEWPQQKPSGSRELKASAAGFDAAGALIKEMGWLANAGRRTANAIGVMFDNFAKQRDERVTELLEANNVLVDEKRARERVCEAARRHIRSFEPGTLVGSELNLALCLRELDGDIWADWCQTGDAELLDEAA